MGNFWWEMVTSPIHIKHSPKTMVDVGNKKYRSTYLGPQNGGCLNIRRMTNLNDWLPSLTFTLRKSCKSLIFLMWSSHFIAGCSMATAMTKGQGMPLGNGCGQDQCQTTGWEFVVDLKCCSELSSDIFWSQKCVQVPHPLSSAHWDSTNNSNMIRYSTYLTLDMEGLIFSSSFPAPQSASQVRLTNADVFVSILWWSSR